jgi:catechol 2,3-dioxygenase-like lactoylglutathione lyase family enzyme
MHTVMESLLDEYDHGTLTRRGLMQALLLLAAPAQARAAAGVLPGRTVNHVQLCVSDLEKSRDFYAKLFGASKIGVYGEAKDTETLALPGNQGWISLKTAPDRRGQMDHYAIGLATFDAERQAPLLRNAFPDSKVTVAPPVASIPGKTFAKPQSQSMFITDPDGFRVQLISKERAG